MSPIRKSGDFQRTQIESWDDYIQEEIAEMHARGEMDNLPDKGKPIKIWKTEVNPEYDLAFSRLKNAGVMPMWMELDQEIGRRTDELWSRLDTVETKIREMVGLLQTPPPTESEPETSLWKRFISWFRTDYREDETSIPTVTSIMATRESERTKFMELAAELDKKLVAYHESLPKGAEHLQKIRWLPQRAARVFDERIALTDWWEESRGEHSS